MKPFVVSVPAKRAVDAYAGWNNLSEDSDRAIMHDGWTLPALKFAHLYEAHAAAQDLAMVSGSIKPFEFPDILITEFHRDLDETAR